jgi:hypothetical protein
VGTHPAHRPFRSGGARRGHPARDNPLRRTCDRVQWWCARLLAVIMLLGLPAASVSAGLACYQAQMHTVRTQSAALHQVHAHTVNDAPDNAPGTTAGGAQTVSATVRWQEHDGTQRSGTVEVKPGTEAGSTLRVWVDRDGDIRSAPPTADQAVAEGWMAGAVTAGTVTMVSWAAWKGLACGLDRHRYAQWDAEWERVEPVWSHRM